MTFCRKIEHWLYDDARINYDFALLEMKDPFDIPSIPNVSPACLPSRRRSPTNVEVTLNV